MEAVPQHDPDEEPLTTAPDSKPETGEIDF